MGFITRRWVGGITAGVFIVGLLALLGMGLRRVDSGPSDSGAAADFTLSNFEGETITLSDLRGHVVVINFWASWCVPCRDEARYLEETWRAYKDSGVVFIGVGYVDTEKGARAFIDEFDISYFNGPDLGTRIANDYGIRGVPETFYVDKNGEIRGMKFGPVDALELELKIEELLAEPDR